MSVVQQRVIKRFAPRSVACIDESRRRTVGFVRPMRVELSLTSEGIHAAISGELDFSTAPRLDRLLRLLEGFSHTVLVDLSGVGFTDSTGLSPLFNSAARRVADGAAPICVTMLSRASQRVLEALADLDDVKLLMRESIAP